MPLMELTDRCADLMFSAKRRFLGRHRARRSRLYCVGIGKTGTHSIATMFSRTVRARHEPQAVPLMEKILAWRGGEIDDDGFVDWVRTRDREMALEVDSSTLNFEILDVLIRTFPDARFLLTIRDCYSWCNSMMGHSARFHKTTNPLWRQMGRFQGDAEHAPEEEVLKQHGFMTLDRYFSYWARHNQEVIDKVPAERLLVVRTDQIQNEALNIARFAGLPGRAVRLERTHEYRNPEKQEYLRQVDRRFVEAKVEQHCRPLMSRFFPEIKSLDDARL